MAYCGKCGTRLFEGLDRCQKCGAPVKFNNIKPGYAEPINSESSNSYVPYNTQSVQITSSNSPKNKFTLLKILMIIVLIMIFACVSILGYFIYSYFSLKNYAAKASEELKQNQVIVLNELVEKSEVPFKVSEEVETLYVKQVKVSYEEVTFPVGKETEINYEITRPDLKEYFETLEVTEIETQEEFDKQLSDEIEMAELSIVTLPVRFEHEPMKKWDTENTIEYLVSVDADETVKDIIPVTTKQVVTESSNLVTTKQTKTTMKIEKSTEKKTEKPVVPSDPYLSVVQDYQVECRNQSYPYTYMIDDLNKDGQLDLIVRTGDCEANYMFVLWTVNSSGNTVKVGEIGGWHTSLYGSYSKNVAYINMCGQGVQTILKYDINGSSGIQETNLFNRQLTMEQETTYGYYNMTSDADIYRLEEKNITEYQYKESRKIKDSDTSMTLEEYIEMIDGVTVEDRHSADVDKLVDIARNYPRDNNKYMPGSFFTIFDTDKGLYLVAVDGYGEGSSFKIYDTNGEVVRDYWINTAKFYYNGEHYELFSNSSGAGGHVTLFWPNQYTWGWEEQVGGTIKYTKGEEWGRDKQIPSSKEEFENVNAKYRDESRVFEQPFNDQGDKVFYLHDGMTEVFSLN